MGLLGWLKERRFDGDPKLAEWRRAWTAATSSPGDDQLAALAARLQTLEVAGTDLEIEHEMLEALGQLARLQKQVEAAGLPIIPTGHRIVGGDLCHFSAPVSVPDDPTQPGGRLILTNRRVLFLGGASAIGTPWHAVREAARIDRDVLLVRGDPDALYRFRCNSFADALCGAYLAGRLADGTADPGKQTRD